MSTERDTSFGEDIKEAIKKRGMSFAAVAKKMNLSRQSIHRLNLRKTFDLEFLQSLKSATGLDYTDYVFNPKHKRYEPFEEVNLLKEPEQPYGEAVNTVEMSLSLKISGDENELTKLSSLISLFRKEAQKQGFKIK